MPSAKEKWSPSRRLRARLRAQRGPLERAIEQSAVDHAKARGWVSRKMNGFGFRSWPDRLFLPPPSLKGGHRFWAEFKRLGEPSTPDQARLQRDLRARGEEVYECDSLAAFIEVFRRHHRG